MNIKVLLFSAAAECAAAEVVFIENASTTEELTSELYSRYPCLRPLNCRIALNKEILNEIVTLKEGDEVAVLPPFSGG